MRNTQWFSRDRHKLQRPVLRWRCCVHAIVAWAVYDSAFVQHHL